jgi:molybdenum cofactor synthesis domain-containing protein
MAKLEPLVKTIDDIVDVSLLSGNRRVLAEDVYSPVNVPNQDRCAVDGYAIISHDTENALAETPTVVRMIGQVDIVSTENLVVSPGTCVKVATGSRIPNGADAVVMVEYTVADHDHIRISRKVESGRDIVRQGEDISKGDRILQHGQVLTPGRIGAAAAIGVNHLKVFRKPNVAIIPTGDEIVTPGHELPDGKIYDINTYTLAAIVTANGGTATAMNPVKDSLSSLTRLLNTSSYDLIVFTGGSSVGEKDFVVDLVRENGEIIFHGIATKPGRPTLFGRINGSLILGLPGFPASALSMGYMILRKILRKMSRLDNEIDTTLKVQLDSSIKSVLGRTDIVPVTIQNGKAIPILKGSSSITGIATGDGYIVIPDIVEKLEKDDLVDVHLY